MQLLQFLLPSALPDRFRLPEDGASTPQPAHDPTASRPAGRGRSHSIWNFLKVKHLGSLPMYMYTRTDWLAKYMFDSEVYG